MGGGVMGEERGEEVGVLGSENEGVGVGVVEVGEIFRMIGRFVVKKGG